MKDSASLQVSETCIRRLRAWISGPAFPLSRRNGAAFKYGTSKRTMIGSISAASLQILRRSSFGRRRKGVKVEVFVDSIMGDMEGGGEDVEGGTSE